MVVADTVNIPWEAIIAAAVFIGGGVLSWAAYVMKQLVEHAKWMAMAGEHIEDVKELKDNVAEMRVDIATLKTAR